MHNYMDVVGRAKQDAKAEQQYFRECPQPLSKLRVIGTTKIIFQKGLARGRVTSGVSFVLNVPLITIPGPWHSFIPERKNRGLAAVFEIL